MSQQQEKDDISLFTYEPLALGQIRLLMPTDNDEELSWTMKVVNLDDEIQFEALSYVWGPQNQETFPIRCNNQRHYVRRNLSVALPYLARRNKNRTRWRRVDTLEEESDAAIHGKIASGESNIDDSEVEKPDQHCEDDGTERVADASETEVNNGKTYDIAHNGKITGKDAKRQVYRTGHCVGWTRVLDHEVHMESPLQPIWIDALCINQHDCKEKTIQIALMNQIYRKANRVWVWLGLAGEHESAQAAVDLLPVIARAVYYAKKYSDQTGHRCIDDRLLMNVILQTGVKTRQALGHLLNNEWFSRVWILQEFMLARSAIFLCGSLSISEELFADSLLKFCTLPDQPQGLISDGFGDSRRGEAVFTAKAWFLNSIVKPTVANDYGGLGLESLLVYIAQETSLRRQCLLPEDRVLGMLGILTPTQYQALREDFFGVTDTAELYTKFSAATLPVALCGTNTYLAWLFLNYASERKKILGLPSWVPDLHHGFTSDKNLGALTTSSRREGWAMKGQRMGEIVILGTAIDTIVSICPPIPTCTLLDFESYSNYLLRLAQWELDAHELCTGLRQAQRRVKALSKEDLQRQNHYRRTLVCYPTADEQYRVSHEKYKAFHVTLQRFARNYRKMQAPIVDATMSQWVRCARKRAITSFGLLYDISSSAGGFLHELDHALEERQLFRTSDGLFGTSKKGVLPGDILCVFSSAPTPHVLRRVSEHQDEAYKLVGNAYVPVLMNGEVDDLGLPEQTILLV